MRFALYDFSGKPVSYWQVDKATFPAEKGKPKKPPSHHIIVIDRSGSMYADMPDVRTMLEKILTLSEFNDPSLKISLISYSSSGDVSIHFAKVTVEDVLKPNSPYVSEIRNLRPTGMTCISQGLVSAQSLIDDKEITAISLHSDGFANDRSPVTENREIDKVMATISARPNTFVNTVAYSRYCDYNLLARIANMGSGSCVQATNIKEVYSALHDTTKLLAGPVAPPLELNSEGFVVFVSKSANKILGARKTLQVRGIAPSDDKTAYLIRPCSQQDYELSEKPVSNKVLYAVARYFLSNGQLMDAKYALMATRNMEMIKKHSRALVSNDLANFAADLESLVFADKVEEYSGEYGMPKTATVLDFLNAVQAGGVLVHMPSLKDGYVRRGVKRIAGVRNNDGSVDAPAFRTDPEYQDWLAPAFKFNNNEPTINMMFTVRSKLVNTITGEVVPEVAGITLDLKDYKNYTIVSDGVVSVPKLKIRVTDKKVHENLTALGLVTGKFDHKTEIDINLADMPVTSFDGNFVFPNVFKEMCEVKVLSSILNELAAVAKSDGQANYSAEQVAELKMHNLTPALYFSAPTTTHYSDLKEAINKGEVDYRTSYQVVLGSKDIVHLKDLYSANEYLARRFTLHIDGVEEKKPKYAHFYNPKAKWGIKQLTAKTKLTPVDDLMFPIHAAILGLGKGAVPNTVIEGVVDAAKDAEAHLDRLYDQVRPLLFYIGCTGIVPESLGLTMYTAEDFEAKTGMKLGKDEKEGTFFLDKSGNTLIVYTTSKLFSTGLAKVEDDVS